MRKLEGSGITLVGANRREVNFKTPTKETHELWTGQLNITPK